jgi:hypothetical protein
MFSAHHKKKRLREGGVGPEICSPALSVETIVRTAHFHVKAKSLACAAVLK